MNIDSNLSGQETAILAMAFVVIFGAALSPEIIFRLAYWVLLEFVAAIRGEVIKWLAIAAAAALGAGIGMTVHFGLT